MSCYGGICFCGSSCKCSKGSSMCPDISKKATTEPIIFGVPPSKMVYVDETATAPEEDGHE